MSHDNYFLCSTFVFKEHCCFSPLKSSGGYKVPWEQLFCSGIWQGDFEFHLRKVPLTPRAVRIYLSPSKWPPYVPDKCVCVCVVSSVKQWSKIHHCNFPGHASHGRIYNTLSRECWHPRNLTTQWCNEWYLQCRFDKLATIWERHRVLKMLWSMKIRSNLKLVLLKWATEGWQTLCWVSPFIYERSRMLRPMQFCSLWFSYSRRSL